MELSKLKTVSEIVTQIQSNPDWIIYGVALLILLLFLIFILSIWRRSKPLALAESSIRNLTDQVKKLDLDSKEYDQKILKFSKEIAGYSAQEKQWNTDKSDLNSVREELSDKKAEAASLTTALENQKQSNTDNIQLLNKTGDVLKEEFKSLASQVMRTHGEDFEKKNKERMSQVLQPLKEHIGRFETELRGVHESAGKDREALKIQIQNLTENSLQVSKEAENLTKALKSDSQKQGAWGEMILASILDKCGLREGEEYETQAHHRNEEGKSLRPDVVVNLPGSRRLVIDSKVSLIAYERAVNSDNKEARESSMKEHIKSVKKHVDTLSAKKYHELDDGAIDYVIMFMPIESAFSEAISSREDMALYATEKRVIIASPTNLMVALKTVENLWSVERRNKNALEIAKRAGFLYDKFNGFLEDMEKINIQLVRNPNNTCICNV